MTHLAVGQFAFTISRSTHFSNPMLRLVQLYLGYNLLGQTNSAAKTSMTELYLVWCANRRRRLLIRLISCIGYRDKFCDFLGLTNLFEPGV